MNARLATLPTTSEIVDRRAAAVADVKQMHDDFNALLSEIGQLRADLNRERDRVSMMVEERNRYRAEAALLRNLLIELSTQMSNIGLLTVKAQEITRTVHDIDKSDTGTVERMAEETKATVNQGETQDANAA